MADIKERLQELSAQDQDKPGLGILIVLEVFKWGGVGTLLVLGLLYGYRWWVGEIPSPIEIEEIEIEEAP